MPLEETNFMDYLSEQKEGMLYNSKKCRHLPTDSTSGVSTHIMNSLHPYKIYSERNTHKGIMMAIYTGAHTHNSIHTYKYT